MFLVDTNILVYAVNRLSPFHKRCRGQLEGWRRQASAWYVTWGICHEFLRVVTHPRVLRPPWPLGEGWRFLEALLAVPSLGMLVPTERHARVAAELFEEMPHLAGNVLHDAATAVLMREHSIKTIYTRDADFHRFAFLEPVDPVA